MGIREFWRRLRPLPKAATGPIAGVAMPPADWADEAGWDTFHEVERHVSPFSLGLRYIPELRSKSFNRIWFPGCGTSLAPRAFAELGFEVLCTDFSTVAVKVQERHAQSPLPQDVAKLLEPHGGAAQPTTLQTRRHDFRTPLDGEPNDVILNMRAFQGLAPDDMRRTAMTHFDAVRPGGWSLFDTINVQGKRRDEIEDAISVAGFQIPLRETSRWYRAALHETGIDFVIILGRPRIPGPNRSAKDQERLDALIPEYQARAEQEAEASRVRLEAPDAKLALIVYSTG